jgi:hypothetical protein
MRASISEMTGAYHLMYMDMSSRRVSAFIDPTKRCTIAPVGCANANLMGGRPPRDLAA